MAKTPAQRGPFGRWLTRVREERYPTQDMAREEMRRLAGIAIGRSEYAQWESGSRVPKADNPKVARLYEFFGSTPEDEADAPQAGESALVAEMRLLREAVVAQTEAQTRGMEALGEVLAAVLVQLAAGQERKPDGSVAPRAGRRAAG